MSDYLQTLTGFLYISGVLCKTCFNVTYTHQRISALIGSTVDLPCTYQHPNNHTVIEMNWYIQGERDEAPTNLSSLPEYSGRVKYLGDNMSDCTLRITDLRETDSAEYKFIFKTQFADKKIAEWGYSFPGTTLTVSGHVLLSSWVPVVTVGAVLTVAVLLVTIYCTLRRRSTGGSDATTDPQSVHPDPNSDMYSALNMRNRSTDYDTLNTHPLTNQQIDAEIDVYENL
ncbi:myelin-oligodendrocyte glycoprotein [Esox lucius]|uniref:myelin-oligodendrocyte glycoprotein n=1 Tax=Esox lucius TaxID=8010 RepID=UPI0014777193|nr:myelin-oligodendrocyte glycoprotein [Esox lucius]